MYCLTNRLFHSTRIDPLVKSNHNIILSLANNDKNDNTLQHATTKMMKSGSAEETAGLLCTVDCHAIKNVLEISALHQATETFYKTLECEIDTCQPLTKLKSKNDKP